MGQSAVAMASAASVASSVTFILISFLLCVAVDCNGSHRHMKPHTRKDHQHYVPTPPASSGVATPVHSLLRETKLLQDADHLAEHLAGVFSEEQLSKMSPQEREFYYFKLHDDDRNERLDGLDRSRRTSPANCRGPAFVTNTK